MNIKISYKKMGKMLAGYRHRSELTQKQVAEGLGLIGPQFISNIERGLCPAPLDTLVEMLRLYGLNKNEKTMFFELLLKEYESKLRKAFLR